MNSDMVIAAEIDCRRLGTPARRRGVLPLAGSAPRRAREILDCGRRLAIGHRCGHRMIAAPASLAIVDDGREAGTLV